MAAASVRMVMTASALRASSAGVAATAAPAAVTGFNLSAERFHTVTLCPTSMSRCAMAAPILPIPAIPICIGCALPVTFPLRCNSGRQRYGIMRARERQSPRAAPSATLSLNAAAAAVWWRVVGSDFEAARRRAMARAGVEIADDAKTLAGEVGTIIPSLPKPAALGATVTAIVNARVRSRVIIEASTFTIDDKLKAERALRKAGHVMLDCPVSGTGAQAKVKALVVYASGDPRAIPRLRPLFAGFAPPVHDLGAFGNGSRMKYVANLLVAINNLASAEAMVL